MGKIKEQLVKSVKKYEEYMQNLSKEQIIEKYGLSYHSNVYPRMLHLISHNCHVRHCSNCRREIEYGYSPVVCNSLVFCGPKCHAQYLGGDLISEETIDIGMEYYDQVFLGIPPLEIHRNVIGTLSKDDYLLLFSERRKHMLEFEPNAKEIHCPECKQQIWYKGPVWVLNGVAYCSDLCLSLANGGKIMNPLFELTNMNEYDCLFHEENEK